MPSKSRPESTPWFNRWQVKCALLLVLVVLFLGGIIWAGRWGREQQDARGRYDVAFADIECEPPAGMTKQDFLDEVQYESRLPDRLSLVDDELPSKLRAAFAKHAWVEKVDEVEIKPPNRLIVKLTYRTPVLAVKVGDNIRAVDGQGVLLPANAPTGALPLYPGHPPPPHGKSGTRWGDPGVEAAASKAKNHPAGGSD